MEMKDTRTRHVIEGVTRGRPSNDEMASDYLEVVAAFRLHGNPYVPHWSKRDTYVAPGYGTTHMDEWSREDLERAGAVMYAANLLPAIHAPKGTVSMMLDPDVAKLFARGKML